MSQEAELSRQGMYLCGARLELEPERAQKSLRAAQRQGIGVPRQRPCPYIRSVSLGGLTAPASRVQIGPCAGHR